MKLTDPAAQQYLDKASEQHRRIMVELLQLIAETIPDVQFAFKWGRITATRDENWHHWICGLQTTAKHVSLNFHKGALLHDPHGLLTGSGKYVRTVRFSTDDPIHSERIADLLRDASAKQTAMID